MFSRAKWLNDRTLAIVPVLFIVVCAVGPAFFVQSYLVTWGYDEFWSMGLAILVALFALVFLIVLWFFSRLASSARDSSVSHMMFRHSIAFAPFLLLAVRFFVPHYQNQRIAAQLFAIFTALLLIVGAFIIHENWSKRERRLSAGVFAKNAIAAVVVVIVITVASLKFHERHIIKRFAANVHYASSQDTTMKVLYAKMPGVFSVKCQAPEDGEFEIAVFPNDHYRVAAATPPLHYEVKVKPPFGRSESISEGELSENEITRIKFDISAFAGNATTVELAVQEPSRIAASLDRIHIVLGRLQRLPSLKGWTPENIMSAYWSEPFVHAPRKQGETNIVLIIFDTLRADHVECLGYEWETTPTIDHLARDGVLFTQTISQSPWTTPSFASLYTGRLPTSHLAGSKFHFAESRRIDKPSKFSPQPNFVDLVREQGYYTIAFVNNPYLGPAFGMHQGFNEYRLYSGDARDASDLANSWLGSNTNKKFFLLLHYMDPHRPYEMKEGFDSIQKTNAGYDCRERMTGEAESESPVPERTIAVRAYDSEIAFADYQMGRVLDKLDELGLLEETLIVFTSDHGEEFAERGGYRDHGHTLFDELLHVPLIMRFPASLPPGKELKTQVRLIDVFPTVLDILNIEFEDKRIFGNSLCPLIANETPENSVAISEFLLYGREQKSIRTEQYKLIYTPATDQIVLYDIIADPGETRDLSTVEPSICAKLMKRLSAELEQSSTQYSAEVQKPVIDEKTMNSLKSLGYVQ
jgi:arylsulfatase A-like enzyme